LEPVKEEPQRVSGGESMRGEGDKAVMPEEMKIASSRSKEEPPQIA
jgi:hypothetical protein